MARLLFVTARLPYPPREGHQLRSWHLLCAAAERHEVDLLCLQRPEDDHPPDPALGRRVRRLTCVPLPAVADPRLLLDGGLRWLAGRSSLLGARYVGAALRAAFRARLEEAELVHLDMLALADLMAEVPATMPLVLNAHNVEYRLLEARIALAASAAQRQLLRWRVAELRAFERRACVRATRVLACSDEDAAQLQALAPAARVAVLPNGVDLEAYRPASSPQPAPHGLVFVGQMGWFPNRDGIAHFLRETFPRIRRTHPVPLQVVGHRAGLLLPDAPTEAVQFTGFLDDLRPTVHAATVYVVPLRVGSGTRLKVLEAMAMGKAIVSTRIGAEGIGLRDGIDALLADTPEAFAAAVCRLLDDASLRQRLGAAARASAEARFGWTAIGARLLSVYDELLAPPRQASQR